NRPAWMVYFIVPTAQPVPLVTAELFLFMDAANIAVLRLDVPSSKFNERVKNTFEAVGLSISVDDPQALQEQRRRMLEAGQNWLRSLSAEQLRSRLMPDQWFRIVHGDKDVGYMRISQHH